MFGFGIPMAEVVPYIAISLVFLCSVLFNKLQHLDSKDKNYLKTYILFILCIMITCTTLGYSFSQVFNARSVVEKEFNKKYYLETHKNLEEQEY
jgi:hypothetical protein